MLYPEAHNPFLYLQLAQLFTNTAKSWLGLSICYSDHTEDSKSLHTLHTKLPPSLAIKPTA